MSKPQMPQVGNINQTFVYATILHPISTTWTVTTTKVTKLIYFKKLGEISAQLANKKSWKHYITASFFLWVASNAHPQGLNWYASPGRTIVSNALNINLLGRLSRGFIKLHHMMKLHLFVTDLQDHGLLDHSNLTLRINNFSLADLSTRKA